MGVTHELHMGSIAVARGYRQLNKAGNAFYKDKVDSGSKHLEKALDDFGKALNYYAKAEEDAYIKAGEEIDKGNSDLAKSIEEYGKGHDGRAEEYLDKAANCYDKAMDMIG
ncbi:MAG: hypothetical protein IFK93_11910 [Acidobacteria bacterium]|jgi:tetratricopeptide (TPR) repeat protein|nr:hypothetical protein [Candidatus Sulfomarinibacter kjeldsenii]